jgi:uncharacterized membrane protein YphA (DoxX/SURF4 family)
MKALSTLAAILLIAAGVYFVYDGYQMKQTTVAQVEQGISSAIRSITDNTVKTSTRINNESAVKMIGGGAGVLVGFLLLAGSLRKGKRKR